MGNEIVLPGATDQAGLTAKTAGAMGTAWQYAEGRIRVPDAPGLGVDVSEKRLEPFIVRR